MIDAALLLFLIFGVAIIILLVILTLNKVGVIDLCMDKPGGHWEVRADAVPLRDEAQSKNPKRIFQSGICPICGSEMIVVTEPMFYTDAKEYLCDKDCRMRLKIYQDESIAKSGKVSPEKWKKLSEKAFYNSLSIMDRAKYDYKHSSVE